MSMRVLRRVAAASFAGLVFAAAGGAPMRAAQQEGAVIEVAPRPIGAAIGLTATRSVDSDAMPSLPLTGLVVAGAERPVVRTRRGEILSATSVGSGKITTLYQIPVQDSTTKTPLATYQPAISYDAPALTTINTATINTAIDTATINTATIDSTSKFGSYLGADLLAPSIGDRLKIDPALSGKIGSITPIDAAPALPSPGGDPNGSGSAPADPAPPVVEVPEDEDESSLDSTDPESARLAALEAAERDRERQLLAYSVMRERLQELSALRKERRKRREAQEAKRRDVQGPSALGAINLLENLHVDREVELFQSDVLQIASEVYLDANPETGLVYYMPKRYDLAWDPESQYAMTVIYGMAGEQAEEGEVFMAARLRTGVDTHELEVAKDLLRAYLRRHAKDGFTRLRELRPAPLASTSNIELFGGAQNEFTVPADRISVQRVSGFLEAIDVSWSTDVRRLLNVESLLRTDAGIHGTATFDTAGSQPFRRTVPLEISVASDNTFGRIRFERSSGWRNASLYPVKLHTLHALLLSPQSGDGVRKDDPLIYSWDLDDARVPPGASVRWNADAVPAWLDQNAKLMWVAYSVDGSCEACDDRVFDERFIPALPSSRNIVFTTGDAFEATGAERITVHLRSPFLEPQRERIVQQPGVRLSADGEEYTITTLFLSDREFAAENAHEPFYEFFLEVTLRDGTTYTSPEWTPSRSLDYLLGSKGLEEALGGRVWESAALDASDDAGDTAP